MGGAKLLELSVLPESASSPEKDTSGFVANPELDETEFDDLAKEQDSISKSRKMQMRMMKYH